MGSSVKQESGQGSPREIGDPAADGSNLLGVRRQISNLLIVANAKTCVYWATWKAWDVEDAGDARRVAALQAKSEESDGGGGKRRAR